MNMNFNKSSAKSKGYVEALETDVYYPNPSDLIGLVVPIFLMSFFFFLELKQHNIKHVVVKE
jgi:hypothetical protein